MRDGLYKNYPIVDGHRHHYVKYPVQNTTGKWVAVAVYLPTGHSLTEGESIHFNTEAECQKTCDVHNKWVMGSLKKAEKIIDRSTLNAVKTDKAHELAASAKTVKTCEQLNQLARDKKAVLLTGRFEKIPAAFIINWGARQLIELLEKGIIKEYIPGSLPPKNRHQFTQVTADVFYE